MGQGGLARGRGSFAVFNPLVPRVQKIKIAI